MLPYARHTAMRLRVCRDAGRPVAGELLDDAIACIESDLDFEARHQHRDDLIRRSSLLLGDAPLFTKARMLETEAKALARIARMPARFREPPAPQSARYFLAAAAGVMPIPTSLRQYYRVLQGDPD